MLKSKTIVSKSEMILFRPRYIRALELFFQNPSKSFHVNGIIKKTAISSGLAVDSLKELENLGILSSKKIANSLHYRLQNENQAVKELKRFYFLNNSKLKKMISELLKIPQITKVIVYGSMAKGEYDENSDIDICVVGVDILDIDIAIYEKSLKRRVQLIKFSITQFDRLKEKDVAFYIELLRGVSFERSL